MLYRICGYMCLSILFLNLVGCAEKQGEKIPASTLLLSSSLAPPSSAKSLIPSNYKLSSITTPCSAPLIAACTTPSNVIGTLYYSGIMVGDRSGYSLGTFGPLDPSPVAEFKLDELSFFDFQEKLSVTGEMTCCDGSPYPNDENATVSRIEMYFGYVDVEFQIGEGDTLNDEVFSGTHTVRNVYGDIVELGYMKGDLLYKGTADQTFLWCDTELGCVHETRPTNPIQNIEVAEYSGTSDGLGSQIIPTFAVNLTPDHETIRMPKEEVLNNQWGFDVDFNMQNGIAFDSDPDTWTRIFDMLQSFKLQAQPGNSEGGFSVTITASKLPL